MTMRQIFVIVASAALLIIGIGGLFWPGLYWALMVIVPLTVLGLFDMFQTKSTLRRLYPVLAYFRYMLESVRKEIQQYFVESDLDERPIAREFRSLVYQRAKGERDTRPFGTIFDVNRPGYEWINHSLGAKAHGQPEHRIQFGGNQCTQPYMAAPINISAMSYGSLSKNAIMALNRGAKIGGFSHNTGEGSLSPYHLEHGGDIVWQIGTGYFGCRDEEGNFNPEMFRENSQRESVKMIEIKLSQGAKPGHGGILPATKVTEEIARIRHVPMGQDVISPPGHSTFDSPVGLLQFVAQLRELSGGKPVGFKLCVGRRDEFLGICKAMLETKQYPDFITVDGGEGGTGAAPTEMTNSVGTPLRDGLIFVHNALIGCGLRDKMRIIASGKILSAFHAARAMALGADTVNSARGMMLALGCIQARACNTDHCPTGIATTNPNRVKGLVVTNKAERVANYQRETVINLAELIAAAGLDNFSQLRPEHINRRVQGTDVKTYAQLYPVVTPGSFLDDATIPAEWRDNWAAANTAAWA